MRKRNQPGYSLVEVLIALAITSIVLLTVVTLMIVLLGGFRMPATWVLLIIYFICWHSAMILFGVRGLACAMAGKYYVYPLIGVRTWQA